MLQHAKIRVFMNAVQCCVSIAKSKQKNAVKEIGEHLFLTHKVSDA